MATNNVIKQVEIKAANNLEINKLLGADAQNVDVGLDAEGNIIHDVYETPPAVTYGLSDVLREFQHVGDDAVSWEEKNYLGAKNLIPFGDGLATTSGSGITYSVASNGIITISGTASNENKYTVEFPNEINEATKFTIDCSAFSVGGTGISILLRKPNGTTNIAWFGASGETDGTKEISVPANSQIKYFTIVVTSGVTALNLVIKPMLRLADIKNREYVPYAKTNRELTTDIEDLINRDTGHTIINSIGVSLDQRTGLQFVDSKASDDETNNKTKIEVVQAITQSRFATAPDGIYNITDEPDEVLSADDVAFDNVNTSLTADNVQDAVDQMYGINTFNVASTAWTQNSDPNTSDYPYVCVINTQLYTNDSRPTWQLVGANGIPTATEQETIDMVLYAWFSSSSITLYATDEPASNLVLEVKGV